ncbi:MAG: DUF547 domain-containing protein [Bacteroidota bacterium]
MLSTDNHPTAISRSIQALGAEFLRLTRAEKDVTELLTAIAEIRPADLALALPNDAARKTFWINLYNGFNLYCMRKDPRINSGTLPRMRHFLAKKMMVAGTRLSLMNLENDLLRRGQLWWGMGYVRRPGTPSFFRQFRTEVLDPRIHFALNCGAMSCPPIRYYEVTKIEAQLERATRGFMLTEVRTPDKEPDVLRVSGIFRLYRGDFGGKVGIRDWVQRYRPDLSTVPRTLKWLPYDWTTNLDAFA